VLGCAANGNAPNDSSPSVDAITDERCRHVSRHPLLRLEALRGLLLIHHAELQPRSRQDHARLGHSVGVRLFIAALLVCSACAVTAKPAELVTLPPTPTGPWHVMRTTLDDCAHTYGLVGDMRVRIELDGYGKVISVDAAYGDAFASCVGNALMTTRYRSYANRALLVAFAPTT
jgi:hypothetical protein